MSLSKRKNMFLRFHFARQRVRDMHCIYVILWISGSLWHDVASQSRAYVSFCIFKMKTHTWYHHKRSTNGCMTATRHTMTMQNKWNHLTLSIFLQTMIMYAEKSSLMHSFGNAIWEILNIFIILYFTKYEEWGWKSLLAFIVSLQK